MSTHHFPAHPEAVQVMLAAPEGTGDGRSEWRWFWITDKLGGDSLVFGCFPEGDTYFDVEVYVTEDWQEANRRGLVDSDGSDVPS